METKYCPKCKTEKPITQFYRNKLMLDGAASHCKICHKAADKAYYQRKKLLKRPTANLLTVDDL